MKFIKLTKTNNKNIWINPEKITGMCVCEGKYYTELFIWCCDERDICVRVKETPEEIIEAIKAAEEL